MSSSDFSRSTPGTLVVGSLREENFPLKDAELLQHIANQIAIAVENALAYRQVVDRANKLSEEKLYLQDEIRTEYNFEEIIGDSRGPEKSSGTNPDRGADGFDDSHSR